MNTARILTTAVLSFSLFAGACSGGQTTTTPLDESGCTDCAAAPYSDAEEPVHRELIVSSDDRDPLPNGTVRHRGTLGNAQWLQAHRNNGFALSECVGFVGCGSCLTSEKTQEIVEACEDLETFREKMECLHDEVRAAVRELEAEDGDPGDKDYVCRNFAASAHDVAQQLGLEPDWECSLTHAWIEFTDEDGTQYVLDAYNNILFSYTP